MQMTLNLNGEVLRGIEQLAALRGTTVEAVVQDALADLITREEAPLTPITGLIPAMREAPAIEEIFDAHAAYDCLVEA